MSSLDFIIRRGRQRHPDRVAVIEGDLTWTWRDLDREVNRAALALRGLGIGPERRVAAAGYNSAAYLALYYGAARLGATICPLNYLSTVDELQYVLRDLDPALVLVEDEFRDAVLASRPSDEVEVVQFGRHSTRWQALTQQTDADELLPLPDPEAVHVILYTSGTTGRPKGVCHTQRAHYLDGLGAALGYGLRESDRYVVHAPSFHAASWDHAKLLLVSDGSVVITPRFDPVALMEATSRHEASILFGVPAVLAQLLAHPRWHEFDLSHVRLVYFGGALGSPQVLADFAAALGRAVEYVQIYGLTEAGPFVTMARGSTVSRKPNSIGKVVPGAMVELVDPATGRPVPVGTPGELVVQSETVMKGYWRNEEATRAALRGGWLHTGDLAVRDDDGDLEIVDRLKDMVRSGGENVYAAEVERVLLTHSDVAEAAVVGLPDERWDERVVACLVPRAGRSLDADEVRAFCRERLAGYKVPRQVVVMATFPRTGVGKIAKRRLKDHLQDEEQQR